MDELERVMALVEEYARALASQWSRDELGAWEAAASLQPEVERRRAAVEEAVRALVEGKREG